MALLRRARRPLPRRGCSPAPTSRARTETGRRCSPPASGTPEPPTRLRPCVSGVRGPACRLRRAHAQSRVRHSGSGLRKGRDCRVRGQPAGTGLGLPASCRDCGTPLTDRRRRHCNKCRRVFAKHVSAGRDKAATVPAQLRAKQTRPGARGTSRPDPRSNRRGIRVKGVSSASASDDLPLDPTA